MAWKTVFVRLQELPKIVYMINAEKYIYKVY